MKKISFLMMAVVALAACGRGPQPKPAMNNYSCLGFEDDLKTLRAGDELPRVLQVLGMPAKAYRYNGVFGGRTDVLEYNVDGGKDMCMRVLLHAKQKVVRVVFDAKGRYTGNSAFDRRSYERPFGASVEPLVIDPSVFRP